MKAYLNSWFAVVCLLLATLVILVSRSAHAAGLVTSTEPTRLAASFNVDSMADVVDTSPGNGVCATTGGQCTLRAAVMEANALAGNDTITLPSGVYTLALAGAGEDAAVTGDLDIVDTVTITGNGDPKIDGNALDRIFHVLGSITVTLSGLTIQNGSDAGGLLNAGGNLTLENTTVSNNNYTVSIISMGC